MYHGSIMKSTFSVLLLAAVGPTMAQTTPAKPAVHHTPATRTASPGACAKLPPLSPKIPALPPGTPCPKPLFTIETQPNVKLEYVSPLEQLDLLRETLGIESSSITLAYADTRIGTGEAAYPHKFYTLNYTGYLVDGTKFDSSLDPDPTGKPKEPITIEYGKHNVILGWDTGLAGMHVGGKRRLFIPFQLGYGPNGRPPKIPGKSMLIFDVDLVSVADVDPRPKPTPPPVHGPMNPALPKPATPATPSGTTPAKPSANPTSTPPPASTPQATTLPPSTTSPKP
jgi:peptidylprolyl isomerase